jgi:outer membrane protein TolC
VDDADRAPVPADTFLSAVAEGWTAPGADVLDRGVAQRLDHQASLSLQQSGQVLAKGARLDLRPVIDLRATGFYSARGETDLSKATDRWVGPSGRFELSLDVPFKNDTQRGLLIQREADLRRRQIDAADLERTIRLNITRLSGSLALAAQRLARAQEAVRQYDETIAAEQEKLKAGDSTLVDTILTEQQTTGARLTLVDAEQQYANLVAQLRFELGELVSSADGQNRVSEASLVEVPAGLLGGTR